MELLYATYMVFPAFVVAGGISWIMFQMIQASIHLMDKRIDKEISRDLQNATVYAGPYRTAAKVTQRPEPKPIKPKREFKMPSFNLGKHPKTFGYVALAAACAVGMGAVYDSHILGDGMKNGGQAAFVILGLYFGIMAIHNASGGFN